MAFLHSFCCWPLSSAENAISCGHSASALSNTFLSMSKSRPAVIDDRAVDVGRFFEIPARMDKETVY